MTGLTKKRKLIYEYLCDCIQNRGYPPSVREIAEAVDLKSTSTVHAHLNALEKMGYITRDSGRKRAIILNNIEEAPSGIPILGTVAAGEPILAVQDALGYIPYETADNEEYFALKIKGLSMVKAGILDGDMVIVHRQPAAQSGEIVIAMIDDEATCKRLKYNGENIWLLPENDDYEPIPGDDCVILGKVTAVIRTY